MVEIQFFGLTIESTKLQLFIAAIGVIVAIIFGYLNYKKKSAIASPKTSQFVNDSSGVIQQSYNDVTIEQQTINLNSRENVVSLPAINLHNCTFYIQSMNPNELDKESVVKKISECIIKNAPEFTNTIIKDKNLELSEDKLKLLKAIGYKVEQYSKASGKIIKDANILHAIGTEAYYLGNNDNAFKHFSEALSIAEELKDMRWTAVILNDIGLLYQCRGKPEKALEYYKKALEIVEELKDIRRKAPYLNNIGSVYEGWGKSEKALEYYQKSLELNEELKDMRGKALNINNMAIFDYPPGKVKQ